MRLDGSQSQYKGMNTSPKGANTDTSSHTEGITVITRYETGGLVAYSVDEGETYHPTVRHALLHQAGVTDLVEPEPEQRVHVMRIRQDKEFYSE